MFDLLRPILEWLDSFSALVGVLAVIAILYLIRMLWQVAKRAFPSIKASIRFIEALLQLPFFMESTTKSINEVRQEVLPNEGGSLRDDLETVTLMSEKLDLRLALVEEYGHSDHVRLQELESTIARRREQRAIIQQEADSGSVPTYPVDTSEE